MESSGPLLFQPTRYTKRNAYTSNEYHELCVVLADIAGRACGCSREPSIFVLLGHHSDQSIKEELSLVALIEGSRSIARQRGSDVVLRHDLEASAMDHLHDTRHDLDRACNVGFDDCQRVRLAAQSPRCLGDSRAHVRIRIGWQGWVAELGLGLGRVRGAWGIEA